MTSSVTDNWISTVNSGTYKFTLYIVNSEVYNDPTVLGNNDTAALNSGKALVIAESGVTGAFSIENVIIQSTLNPGNTTGNTTPTGFVFDIYEPLGFSLLDKILTTGIRMGKPSNLTSQSYVLKLEFQGRDQTTGGSKKYPGIFLYNLRISNIKASLGPAGAKYFCVAQSLIRSAMQETVTKIDLVVRDIKDVNTFASGLQSALNASEKSLLSPTEQAKGDQPAREYEVRLGNSTNITSDKMLGVDKFDLATAPWAGATDSGAGSGQPISLSNVDLRETPINTETQLTSKITEAIELNVPTWSNYVLKQQKDTFHVPYVYVTLEERLLGDEDNNSNLERIKVIITINVGSDVTTPKALATDQKKLQTTPSIQTKRFNILPIAKKYNYLYTGENTEVIDFQIDIENLFAVAKAPAAGIYYADNSQQFTSTEVTPVTKVNGGLGVNRTNSQGQLAPADKFLSDVELARINVNQTVPYTAMPSSSAKQQVSETMETSDRIASHMAAQLARRDGDTQNINMEIKGDPFWMGTPDAFVAGAAGMTGPSTAIDFRGMNTMIAFLNYQANEKDLLIKQQRGPVDFISTGVYKVTRVESKFQMGQFTQTLDAYKDNNTNAYLVLDSLINIRTI